jgi:flagellar capping protein FliD
MIFHICLSGSNKTQASGNQFHIINKCNKQKTLSVYNVNSEVILAKGLDAMTKSCEALTAQNERLNKDIENLKNKIDMLQHRLLSNAEERE